MTTRRPDAGLTLIEMMIVLVLIGVATSAAVLGLGRGGGPQVAETEARRLSEMLSLAMDEAITTRRPLRLDWRPTGYAVRRADGGAPVTPRLAGSHDLPGTLVMGEGAEGGVLILSPVGLGQPALLDFSGPSGHWQVRFDGLTALAGAAAS